MIIWSGYGFIVFIIVLIDSLIAELLSNAISNDERFYEKNLTPLGCSFIFSAIIIMLLSKYFSKKKSENKGTRIFDKITIAKESNLFFIPFNYWSYIMFGIGFCTIVWQLTRK
jgi:hypothetical protein